MDVATLKRKLMASPTVLSMKKSPELTIYLQEVQRYPGDVLTGVVNLELFDKFNLLTLEVKVTAEEMARIGGASNASYNPEMRSTLYYKRCITLLGVVRDQVSASVFKRASRKSLSGKRATLPSSKGASPPNPNSPQPGGSACSTDARFQPTFDAESAGGGDSFSGSGSPAVPVTPSIFTCVAQGASDTILQPGSYSFPFTLQLPDDLPPSVTVSKGRDGISQLRYIAKISLVGRGGRSYDAVTPFSVSPLPVQLQRWMWLHYRPNQEGSIVGGSGDAESVTASTYSTIGDEENNNNSSNSGDAVALRKRIDHRKRFTREDEERMELEKNKATSSGAQAVQQHRGETHKERRRQHNSNNTKEKKKGQVVLEAQSEREGDSSSREQSLGDEAESSRASSSSKNSGEQRRLSVAGRLTVAAVEQLGDGTIVDLQDESAEREKQQQGHYISDNKDNATCSVAAQAGGLDEEAGEKYCSPKGKKNKNKKKNGDVVKAPERTAEERAEALEALFPPWEVQFILPLRSSILRKGMVTVRATVHRVVVVRGKTSVGVGAVIDNQQGGASIARVKYSLITRSSIRSKLETLKFSDTIAETVIEHSIPKGSVVQLDTTYLNMPSVTPVTVTTAGASTSTFLNIRLYVSSAFKTFSRSAEMELLVVSGIDTQNQSRRLRHWTNYYRDSTLSRDEMSGPCIDLNEQNTNPVLLDAEEVDGNVNNFVFGSTAMTSEEVSAMQNNSRGGGNSVGAGTSAKSRQVRGKLNFTQATFTPRPEGPAARRSGGAHADPMAGLNPFATVPKAKRRSPSHENDGEAYEQERSISVSHDVAMAHDDHDDHDDGGLEGKQATA